MKKVALVVILAAACGGGSSSTPPGNASGVEMLAGFTVDPVPTNGFQVILPIVRGIAPGASDEWCTWTDKILDTDLDFKAAKGMQSPTGHHVVIYYTTTMQPAGTNRLCTDDDMTSFRFAVGAGGEGANQEQVMPGDLAVHIPKGAQIVMNHHYLNPGTKPVDAQSAVNVRYVDPGAKVVRSGAIAWLDTSLVVPPGKYAMDVKCTMKNDAAFWQLLPHMHKWGQHVTVDHVSGSSSKRLFDVVWDPEFTFHAPAQINDPATPYIIKAGDQINVHCEYNNDTGKNLTFGAEMCVGFGQTVDTTNLGNLACDQGQWGPF